MAFRPCAPCHVDQMLPSRKHKCQGTNLFVPKRFFLMAFRPCSLFLLAEISRAIWIVLRRVGEASFDGIIVNVCAVPQETLAVPDALVGKTRLPDFKLAAQFFFSAIRKVSFHKPDRLFNRLATIESELQMEMVGHHDEVMQPEFFGGDIGSQNVDKEIGHAFGLQKCAADIGFRGHEESARTVLDVVAVCVARRPCHAQGLKPRVYNTDDGMSKLNWFMRASRCCARACGARKGRYFASCGTAKAVP